MSLTDKLSSTNNQVIEDVVRVAKRLYPKMDISQLRNAIWMHWFYGTMDVIYRGAELVACVRWNISPTGKICDVLDWYVKEGENGFRIMKHFMARNWHRWPTLKYIRFFREFKYPGQEPRLYKFTQILRVKEK